MTTILLGAIITLIILYARLSVQLDNCVKRVTALEGRARDEDEGLEETERGV